MLIPNKDNKYEIKGYISKEYGCLYIIRCNIEMPSKCCKQDRLCTHSCVQFGEPVIDPQTGKASIQICDGKILYFSEFEDRRQKQHWTVIREDIT